MTASTTLPRWRAAVRSDATSITEIYNEGIADRIATFETEPRGVADIDAWFDHGRPIAAVDDDGRVAGFAAAFPYRTRPCYAGIGEFSVYVHRDGRGRGIGRVALEGLIETARRRGVWKLVSRIFPENTASRRMCAALGFREVGIYERHGRLDGRWRDCVIVEKLIDDPASAPQQERTS